MHERLGWFIIALATLSVLTVLVKILMATRRLAHLMDLSEPVPERVERSFAIAAADLGTAVPRVAYLDVGERIAATVVGPVILLSRGFADALNDDDLTLVARHELIHVHQRDAGVGVFWHLAFASLLLPGFEPLERRLHAARERRANIMAANGREEAYFAVLTRAAHGSSLCAGGGIGLEAAARRPADHLLMWVSPLLIVLLAVTLPLSHFEFLHDLPFLLRHHC